MTVFQTTSKPMTDAARIRVAVVGTGWLGGGLVRRLAAVSRATCGGDTASGIERDLPRLVPAMAANRTLGKAVAALEAGGFERAEVVITDDADAAGRALEAGRPVATSRLTLPTETAAVDVVMEATGHMRVGAEVAAATIRAGKHMVAANPEVQATVGPILRRRADAAGVVYSDIDGDEPGILTQFVRKWAALGGVRSRGCQTIGSEEARETGAGWREVGGPGVLRVVVAGNGKGVLKRYATPETQRAFAEAHGLKPWIAAAAADGTKLNLELTTAANALGFAPGRRGMFGPATTPDTLLADFESLGAFAHGPIVDYGLGMPAGCFVILHSDDPDVRRDLRYLKLGDGPYYALHQPHVMCHYAAPWAVVAAAEGRATVTPRAVAPVADAVAYAKRDLPAGTPLDGIGGADCYGLIVRAEEVRRDHLLPIGLAGCARVTRAVKRDQPITRDDIAFDADNELLALRREQDAAF